MSVHLESVVTPEDAELQRKKARLAELEAQLADQELALASCLADLVHFEQRYLQTVGRSYALLDLLRAKIAEVRAKQNPRSQEAREQARRAKTKAKESVKAVGDDVPGSTPPRDGAASASKPNRSESLRNLYRQAAKLLHPDLTLDGQEKEKRHRLMAEINAAYSRGDEDAIRSILRDWHASPESVEGDTPGAELIRIIRKIAQVEKRLHAIAAEMERLRQGELFKLKKSVEDAQADGRDLLEELSRQLDGEIVRMREQLKSATNKETR